MIQHLTRNQINIEKYDECISSAINSRIYAYSWYLDIVADKNWDVLILDDYSTVIPLPKRRKYFINYVFQPSWVQQLGIFSSNEIDENIILNFIKNIPRKFKLVDVFFNSDNYFTDDNLKARTNYILPLEKPYDVLFKNFKKGRKSSIKQAQTFDLNIVEDFNHEEIIQLFKFNKGQKINKKDTDYTVLSNLIGRALSLNFGESIAVLNNKKELIGGAFFLKDKQRVTYLFSAINKEGRNKQAMSFLINYVIEKFSKSDYIFDFEGSIIKELASFFKSFGAQKEEYYHYYSKNIFN